MNAKGKIGRRGEETVCDFLLERGHTILERNWRCGHLEIDIISIDKNGIHFVEVKTRVAPLQAAPEESVDLRKKNLIAKAAMRYLKLKFAESDLEAFIDVAAVTFERGKTSLEYFENAYTPIYL